VLAARADADKRGDRAAQVEQRVEFHRCFGTAKARPRKQRQAQIDGGGIEGIDGGVEISADGFASVHRSSDGDQHLSQVGPDAPIMSFVGIGQRGTRDAAPESQMVEAVLDRAQTGFDVTKALTTCQLGEGHRQKLIHARETTMSPVTAVAAHTTMELMSGQVADHLGEDSAAGVHAPLSTPKDRDAGGPIRAGGNSNRKRRQVNLTSAPSVSCSQRRTR
jgi:hypothetical protein